MKNAGEAALKIGLEPQEIQSTIRSSVQAGKKQIEESNPYSSLETAPWPIPDKNAFYGLAGEFAQFAVEQSEADLVAVLATFLCRFGVEAGHSPYMFAGEKQFGRINAALGRQSSKARKETSALPILAKERADLPGSVLNRSEAYVRRIALIHSLFDGCESVELPHLKFALALWDFCEQSAQFIFAGMETDSTCQKILEALEESGGTGISSK